MGALLLSSFTVDSIVVVVIGPIPTAVPLFGSPEYRGHIVEMLARLPEQFKAKRT